MNEWTCLKGTIIFLGSLVSITACDQLLPQSEAGPG